MEPTKKPPKETTKETTSNPERIAPLPKPDPLWSQMGLPKPGRGVTLSHLTAPVLDVWAHWWNCCHNTKRPGVTKPRTIGHGPVRAIRAALGKGYSAAELQDVIRYAFKAPDGSPHVDWWRSKPHFLSPATILGKELDRNQTAAALWASGDMPKPQNAAHPQMAVLKRLMEKANAEYESSDAGDRNLAIGQSQERTAGRGGDGSNGAVVDGPLW
tara:strand:- start:505 stop:1146 length:642 start_codon:yes stop_codon:yes gene_type:complete